MKAVDQLENGKVLVGGVGSGKSRTSLAYFYKRVCGGNLDAASKSSKLKKSMDLYIITTARKRDDKDWEKECEPFFLSTTKEDSVSDILVTVDSWNNIGKYKHIKDAFFIFDEQRVIGSGTWVKSFLTIAKANQWILLTATPGDVWTDYIPVFIANGFYKNRTEFINRHVVYNNFTKYPKIDRYVEVQRLIRLRESVIVKMRYKKQTVPHDEYLVVGHDQNLFDTIFLKRWNPYDNKPIKEVGQLYYLMRRAVNSDPRRLDMVAQLIKKHPKVVVFYNHNYERDLLLELGEKLNIPTSQWNGHKHEPIPKTKTWMYIVQYAAGAEGWNCIETDTTIFYSQNYSYKATIQAAGRIDRRNTPFTDLYYYYLISISYIDKEIKKAFDEKRNFNENQNILD